MILSRRSRVRCALTTACLGVIAAHVPAQALHAQEQPPVTSSPPAQTAAGDSSRVARADTAMKSGMPLPPTITPRSSWTSDRRDFAVGDILTVLIDDYTISTAVKENLATDTRTRGLSVNARLPETSKNVGLDARNAADQTQRGTARRENRFQNEMSVRVISVGANGLLEIEGSKIIDVDKSKQDVALSGWVRAQDISMTNLIESSRVADLQIGYVSPGPLGKPKQGLISRILGVLWP